MIKWLKLFYHKLKAAWWMFSLSHNARELTLLVGKSIKAAQDINHDMVWGRGEYIKNGNTSKLFYILCAKTESAVKAHELLEKDLPLCTTDLGEGYKGIL